jgi:hypothetical protein
MIMNPTRKAMKSPLFLIAALVLTIAGLCFAQPLNILYFTADDMNFDSSAVFGGPIKDLTPNVDKLAAEGLRFNHAYSTVAVCQPVRQTQRAHAQPTTARRRIPHLALRQGPPPPAIGSILLGHR